MLQPHWRPAFTGLPPSPQLRSWLAESGSLTRRCQALCQGFRVRLLTQQRMPGRSPLGLHWARDVLLECDAQAVIFAHTTLPCQPRGRLALWLARLGERSLGSLLFSCPGFQRGRIEYCRLDRRHALYRAAARVQVLPVQVWARRSEHRLAGQKVMVTEVFLPALLLAELRSKKQ